MSPERRSLSRKRFVLQRWPRLVSLCGLATCWRTIDYYDIKRTRSPVLWTQLRGGGAEEPPGHQPIA